MQIAERPTDGLDAPPALASAPEMITEPDLHHLAQTFAATPEAVRMAVARVGTGFRDVQRELGGRR